jgi:hypothetical protein
MRAVSINFKITAKEVKDMAKFLVLWHFNPMAPWPTDPAEMVKLSEMLNTQIDQHLKTGEIREFGYFLNGRSGYSIGVGESANTFGRVFSFYPFIEAEVHEIVPYETAVEIMRGVMKAKAEAMKK